MTDIIRNIILGISLAAPIGPVNIEVIRRGLNFGFFPAFLLSIGAASADTTYLLLIYFGLSSFIKVPIIKTLIWIFGGFVLIYLGYQSIKNFKVKVKLNKSVPKIGKNSFITGYLITISNPMTIVWWIGVFGSILGTSIYNVSKTIALLNSLTIIIGVILWFFILSLVLHWGKSVFKEKHIKYVNLTAGIILVGFGLYFLYNAAFSV
jgi:threonine/homoserine/homoserine lactone efflux protein